jgi:hypothetical protein
MVSGALIGAALVLVLVLCEGGSGFLWRDSGAEARFYCPVCDLRYTRFEVRGGRLRVCPFGHATAVAWHFRWTTALVTACITFIVSGTVMVGTGFLR